MQLNREAVLQALELVVPGLSSKDVTEQASCFVFRNGFVETFNAEIYCRAKSKLPKDLAVAVQADPLLALLRRLPDEEIRIYTKNDSLRVKGKGREAGLKVEKDILLDFTDEAATDWSELKPEFHTGLALVEQCASRDASQFQLTCVHITPKWVEASDSFQVGRFRVRTNVPESLLIRRESARHILSLGLTEIATSESWLHFRSKSSGMSLSCRRHSEDFPDVSDILKVEGETVQFPKSLPEALGRSEIFAGMSTTDETVVEVSLEPGRVVVEGQGPAGWYRERRKMAYDGPSLTFCVAPLLLASIVKEYGEAIVSPNRLFVKGGPFSYVTCLGVRSVEDNDDASSESEDE